MKILFLCRPSTLAPFVVVFSCLKTWVDVVVVQHKGEGKVCPGVLEEEQRDCLVDCPAGAPNPSAAVGKGEGSEHKDGEDGGAEAEPVAVGAMEQTYCSIEEELWTPCSVDCIQERYMGEECDKDAEVGNGAVNCPGMRGCISGVVPSFPCFGDSHLMQRCTLVWTRSCTSRSLFFSRFFFWGGGAAGFMAQQRAHVASVR